MKTHLFGFLLAMILSVPALTGCRMAGNMEAVGREAVRGLESTGNSIKQAADTTTVAVPGRQTAPVLTLEEAQDIALKHAGVTADQVTALRTEYEVEHGAHQYDVEFRYGNWEYDYEIHADTGEILSYSKDD